MLLNKIINVFLAIILTGMIGISWLSLIHILQSIKNNIGS